MDFLSVRLPETARVPVALFLFVSFAFRAEAQQRYEFTHRQMGTTFRILLYASDSVQAREAAAAAFSRVDTLNAILSDYREDSELSKLSRTAGSGQWVQVSPDLWRVLRISHRASRKSNGAFDLTIGPLVQLWRRARRQHELPSAQSIIKAKAAVGYGFIQYRPLRKAVFLQKPGMQLDPGGIGKGYAVDEALKVLKRAGIAAALVHGGGNLALGTSPPGKRGWQVRLGVIEGDTIHAITVGLHHVGVSTSGDHYQYVEIDGQRYSHIVDPSTGAGLTNQRTVSVIARKGVTADWLSTAASVMDRNAAFRLLRKVAKTDMYMLQPVPGPGKRLMESASSQGLLRKRRK
jgi:thiamine biosynthesis lipoprotein